MPKSTGRGERRFCSPHPSLCSGSHSPLSCKCAFKFKEAQVKCTAGLPLAMLALPRASRPGRGSLRQAVTLGWHRDSLHQLTWPEQHPNTHQGLRKGLRVQQLSHQGRGGSAPPCLERFTERSSRFTKHSPVSVLYKTSD